MIEPHHLIKGFVDIKGMPHSGRVNLPASVGLRVSHVENLEVQATSMEMIVEGGAIRRRYIGEKDISFHPSRPDYPPLSSKHH
jgi:hypothetical protein